MGEESNLRKIYEKSMDFLHFRTALGLEDPGRFSSCTYTL
jgi:hypothetical protein